MTKQSKTPVTQPHRDVAVPKAQSGGLFARGLDSLIVETSRFSPPLSLVDFVIAPSEMEEPLKLYTESTRPFLCVGNSNSAMTKVKHVTKSTWAHLFLG